jgi:Undecaprenyl-phosphate galactose phosphotransferase WbaP
MSTNPAFFTSALSSFTLRHLANRPAWITTACILMADFWTLTFAFGVTVLGRHVVTPGYTFHCYWEVFQCLAMLLGAFWIQGLYPGVLLHPAEEMRRIFLSISTVFLVMASTTFLWRNAESYSRSVFLITWAAGAPLVLLSRFWVRHTFAGKSWWGVPALVLGSGPAAQRVVRSLRDGTLGVKVAGVLSEDQILTWAQDLPPLLGHPRTAPDLARYRVAQYAIVAMPQKSNVELRHAIQDYCRGFSHVLLIPDLPGLCSLGLSPREIGGEVGFEMPQCLFHRSAGLIKRSLDLILGFFALSLVAPLFLAIIAAIKLTSRGPVFYRQSRYGRKGQPFKALKFRTMVPNADSVLSDHLAAHPECLLEWQRNHKLKNDPRVTRVGRWLRQFSLDELPQLLNVLSGHMSLVGPRPIVHAEIPKYGRGYSLYMRVRPGITGLWQVSGRNNTTYEQRVALDEYYVHNWSVWLDAHILIKTITVVVTAEGAY